MPGKGRAQMAKKKIPGDNGPTVNKRETSAKKCLSRGISPDMGSTEPQQEQQDENKTVRRERPQLSRAPVISPEEEVEDEDDKTTRRNCREDKGASTCERAKSPREDGSLIKAKKQLSFEENNSHTAKKKESSSIRGTPTEEKIPGENGPKIIKETQKTTTQSAKKSGSVTTAAQVQPNANDVGKGARPKTSTAPAKSPEEEVESEKDKIKRRNSREVKGVGAKSQIKVVALGKAREKLSLEGNETADAAKIRDSSSILHQTLDKLKIRMPEKSKASEVINKIEKVILEHLKTNTICFKQVQPPIHTGSYYEHLKISNPDEFDIMFPIPVERVDIQPFSEDGAFYTASLKRSSNGFSPLKKFLSESNILPASEILKEFRTEVIKSLDKFQGVEINRKKQGCPAVTLNVHVDSRLISVDIVLCIGVRSSWPPFTKDGLKIEGWLGRKVKLKYKYVPYYLVPKYQGRGTVENNGVLAKDAWRVSFSHVEKDIINNHGSEKTCCEKDGVRCCRKDCLKLLKHLLSLLKDQEPGTFDKFCSYYAKTMLLHACCSRTKDIQWAATDLSQCFEQLLKDFEEHLQRHQLSNFFIPAQNLLSGCSQKSCRSLALRIKEQRENGFPIFD